MVFFVIKDIYNKNIQTMKKLYYLDKEEKNRILNLHESSTRKQYLMNEQTAGSALYATAGAAATGAAIGSVVPVVGTAVGAVVGGAIGLISSIGSGINRGAFNSTITQICSTGAGKPTLNGGQLMDIAKKINEFINYWSLDGYATNKSRAGIKQTLGEIPTVPDLCGVMTKYKDIYNIGLLADLTREIYKDTNWTDTVKFPLMKAIEASKEATAKAQASSGKGGIKAIGGSIASIAKTIQDWAQYPCVSKSNNVTPITLSDGSMAYEGGGFRWFGNRRNMNLTTKVMGDWHCDPADINRIKGGVDPKAQATTTKSTATTGGAPVTGMGSILITPQQVTTLRTNAGLTGTGNSLSQQDINDLYNTINKLPNKQ